MDLRLTRRGLLAGVLAAATVSACSSAPGATPAPTISFDPPGDAPLAVWELTGGLNAPGMAALRPPRLVIYGDGEAIADATYRSRLDPDQLRGLATTLADDLRANAAQKKPTGAPSILDAPTTKLTVWSASGTLTCSAEGLDELKPDHWYPDVLYDARDRLATVHKAVSATAQPYLATRVRVVAIPALEGTAGSVAVGTPVAALPSVSSAAWPPGITLPAPDHDGLRRADLDGDAARAAVRLLTRDLDQRGAWPTYRLQDGTVLRASWRYLLPNE
ncbi:hypothetical protein AB0M46_50785 [Dactylosporangium sp. NPDC051485]|uniref:hypothetical protein n=1 Tax=Dactylosporangium sp. NPDC051485 TaxID=3154846 RepID=UPI0034165B98